MDDRLAARLELAGLSDEEFVRRAYRLVLRRDPEPAALERDVSRATLVAELVASEEFAELRALDDAITRALAAGGPARFLEAPPGTDERAVEIPWALSRLGSARRVLDVGSANAQPAYLAALVGAGVPELVGVDLVEAEIPEMQTVVADVRDLPFPDSAFDLVLCISTLEHVGRDNRVYGGGSETDGGELEALRELRRVTARGGPADPALLAVVDWHDRCLPRRELEPEGRQAPAAKRPRVLLSACAERGARGVELRLGLHPLLGRQRAAELRDEAVDLALEPDDLHRLVVRLVLEVADRDLLREDHPEARELDHGLLHARVRNPDRQVRLAVLAGRRPVVD